MESEVGSSGSVSSLTGHGRSADWSALRITAPAACHTCRKNAACVAAVRGRRNALSHRASRPEAGRYANHCDDSRAGNSATNDRSDACSFVRYLDVVVKVEVSEEGARLTDACLLLSCQALGSNHVTLSCRVTSHAVTRYTSTNFGYRIHPSCTCLPSLSDRVLLLI